MAIYLNLVEKDIWNQLIKIDSEEAEEKDILLAHSKKHFTHMMSICQNKLTGEPLKHKQNIEPGNSIYVNKFTTQSALWSCGSTIEAV